MASLHEAIRANDVGLINYLLLTKRGDPNVNEGGIPPLFLCKSGEAAGALLKAGANKEYQYVGDEHNPPGMPLHTAAAHGRASVVEQLIAAGAVVDSRSSTGRTPLHTVISSVCVKMLVRAHADVNAVDMDGYTPLIVAAGSARIWVTDALLNAGALVNRVNVDLDTALLVACERWQYSTAMRLLRAGADATMGRPGRTPLHLAATGRPRWGPDCYANSTIRFIQREHNRLAQVYTAFSKAA